VSSSLAVRRARIDDVAQMARLNVRCWQETYRGLMSDGLLDDPGFVVARERFWTAALTDERYRENRVAVAEQDGEMIGIAMSGPALDAAAEWARQLYVLYVRAVNHGTGAGQVLLEAVVDPEESIALWVADPNPRAQAFYRKHGFVADGTVHIADGVREVRMIRGMERSRHSGSAAGSGLAPSP
jgi:GNAT superfamily N-acetyltransferase